MDACICVCSCDAYSDIWPVFFHFFRKHWPNCTLPIYLNTETKGCSQEGLNITVINDDNPEDSWSMRMKKMLKKIPYKYVLVILDDFFLLEDVKSSKIHECIQYLESDNDIACFNFRQVKNNEIASDQYPMYKQRDARNTYWVNLLPALWRKKALQSLLSPYENAWQFEWFGTERAKLSRWKFYELLDTEKPIVSFNISISEGYGLCQGKWTYPTRTLFCDEKIELDLNERGFCNIETIRTTVEVPKMLLKHRLQYLVFGGLPYGCYICGKKRMSILQQLSLLAKQPRLFFRIMLNKLRFLITADRGEIITTE